jgi:hypothetical protein
MIRSVLAVLAGVALLTATSFAIEAIATPLLLGLFPQALPSAAALASNAWVRAFTFAYGLACVAAGGYCAARIARLSPIAHAAAMGILQAGLTIAAMLSPEGYHASRMQWIAIAVLSIPAALAGGMLCRGKKLDERLEKATAGA